MARSSTTSQSRVSMSGSRGRAARREKGAWRLTDLHHVSGLPVETGSRVTIALVPRRSDASVVEQIARGIYPREIAFAFDRLGNERGVVIARLPVTEVDNVEIV